MHPAHGQQAVVPLRTVGVLGAALLRFRLRAAGGDLDRRHDADYFPFPHETVGRADTRIINEVRGINRVVYDITSKPPGTIEWE